MASSSNPAPLFLSFFTVTLLISISSLPVLHARDIRYFSQTTHTSTPAATQPTEQPSTIPSTTTTASTPATTTASTQEAITGDNNNQEQQQGSGYGLYGQESSETYQYSPTTSNPTVSSTKRTSNYNYDDAAAVQMEGGNIGNRWTGQGMSDNRRQQPEEQKFPQQYSFDGTNTEMTNNNNKRRPRFSTEGEGERGSHGEVYYNSNNNINNNNNQLMMKNSYGTVERQGMSDTRFLENGKYFYDIINEEKRYNNNDVDEEQQPKYEAESYEDEDVGDEEEEDGHDRMYQYQNNNKYYYNNGEKQGMSGDDTRNYMENQNGNTKYSYNKQGMSDTRYAANGKFFYDINKDNNNNNNVFDNNNNQYNSVNQNNNREEDGYKSNANANVNNANGGGRFDFRNTVNKFPKYEFDSMDEYMKQNGYNP